MSRYAEGITKLIEKMSEEDAETFLEFVTGHPPGHFAEWKAEQAAKNRRRQQRRNAAALTGLLAGVVLYIMGAQVGSWQFAMTIGLAVVFFLFGVAARDWSHDSEDAK